MTRTSPNTPPKKRRPRPSGDGRYVSSFEEELKRGSAYEPPREEAPREEAPHVETPPRAQTAQRPERVSRRSKIRRRRRVGWWDALREDWKNAGGIDMPFLLLLLGVAIAGLIMLFSASYTAAYYKYGDAYHFITSQLGYTALGLVAMWFISKIPYRALYYLAYPILAAAMVLLVLVLFIGTNNNTEATRWLDLGFVTFQPSEIAKAAIIIVSARMCIDYRDSIKEPMTLLRFVVLLGVTAFLLIRQPHLSATIIVVLSGAVVMFLGGANIAHLLGLAGVGIAGMYVLVFKIGYQYDRIESWLDPWSSQLGDGFQLLQSLYAVGSGGWFGLGLGQSRQKQMYLPEPYNDFIFAIACEELGFIGAGLLVVLFAVFYIRGFTIALKSRDTFGTLLVAGFVTQLALQTFLNIGVVTGLLPVTGASLPFFSSGGSSLLMLYAEVGVILSVSRQMAGNEKSQ